MGPFSAEITWCGGGGVCVMQRRRGRRPPVWGSWAFGNFWIRRRIETEMDDSDLELLLKYPLITPRVENNTKHYTGRVLCGNRDLDLHIVAAPNNQFLLKTKFGSDIDATIANIKSLTITDYIDKLVEILSNKTSNHTSVYRKILHEYSEFTSFHLTLKKCSLSSDLSKISLSTLDEGGREHNLEITIDFQTKDFHILKLDLPVHFPQKSQFLTEMYTNFVGVLDSLQPFFDTIDILDENCCILDPEKPTRKDCFRRVWLDHNLSVMVTVDPLNVHARPELKFLGPERVVEPYRHKLGQNLEDWDENVDLLQWLLGILELEEFPKKTQQDRVMLMDVGECSICFSLRLDEKLPEVICDNKSCENFYHVACLYEWLTSVNSKRIFNQVQGECPNCEKSITCPIPGESFVNK